MSQTTSIRNKFPPLKPFNLELERLQIQGRLTGDVGQTLEYITGLPHQAFTVQFIQVNATTGWQASSTDLSLL